MMPVIEVCSKATGLREDCLAQPVTASGGSKPSAARPGRAGLHVALSVGRRMEILSLRRYLGQRCHEQVWECTTCPSLRQESWVQLQKSHRGGLHEALGALGTKMFFLLPRASGLTSETVPFIHCTGVSLLTLSLLEVEEMGRDFCPWCMWGTLRHTECSHIYAAFDSLNVTGQCPLCVPVQAWRLYQPSLLGQRLVGLCAGTRLHCRLRAPRGRCLGTLHTMTSHTGHSTQEGLRKHVWTAQSRIRE